jgi:hypothetical protein
VFVEFAPKIKNPLAFGEWVRNLRLPCVYAADSPECRLHVHVLVRMAMGAAII